LIFPAEGVCPPHLIT